MNVLVAINGLPSIFEVFKNFFQGLGLGVPKMEVGYESHVLAFSRLDKKGPEGC